jgi:hypothetical protein
MNLLKGRKKWRESEKGRKRLLRGSAGRITWRVACYEDSLKARRTEN